MLISINQVKIISKLFQFHFSLFKNYGYVSRKNKNLNQTKYNPLAPGFILSYNMSVHSNQISQIWIPSDKIQSHVFPHLINQCLKNV